MIILHSISIALLFTVLSCGHTIKNFNQNIKSKNDSVLALSSGIKPDYILFGVYCGKCTGHCATMYQYNMTGNGNTLFVDSTDSYLKNNGDVIFKTQISDRKKIDLANSIVRQIPKELLTTTKETERFGCPDCADGCGIYFELKQEKEVKKFYIDFDTSQLTGNMKAFAEFMKLTIEKLKAKA